MATSKSVTFNDIVVQLSFVFITEMWQEIEHLRHSTINYLVFCLYTIYT